MSQFVTIWHDVNIGSYFIRHNVAEIEVKKLMAALARQQGAEEKEASSHLFQKLSILLQRGNATLFLNRTPHNM